MVRKRGERQTETETKRQRQRDRETDRQRDTDKDRETEHEKNNCETNDIILDTFTSTREVRGMNILIYISFCKQIQVCIPYRIHTYTYDKVAIVIIV